MARLRTLLLAIASVALSAVTVQAADLESRLRAVRSTSYHHQHWGQSRAATRCALVEGVRGATPLTVPFFASGWSPGPTYLVGWQRCTCCAAEPVISVNY